MTRLLISKILIYITIYCSTSNKAFDHQYTRVKIDENVTEKQLNLTFQIIAAIGSLATFGSFIYLFRRDKDKQIQIDKLANVVTNLKDLKEIENQKLNLSVRPDIKVEGCGYNGTDGELFIDIINIGEKAKLIKFELRSEDLILHNEHLPYVMEKNTSRKIFARTIGEKHIKDCEYEILIHYIDKIENKHISIIKGIAENGKLVETKYNCR